MRPLSYSGYRFPPEIIQHAIWLYLRFTLSFRDGEELLAERDISAERPHLMMGELKIRNFKRPVEDDGVPVDIHYRFEMLGAALRSSDRLGSVFPFSQN